MLIICEFFIFKFFFFGGNEGDVIFRSGSTSMEPVEDDWLPDIFMGLTLHLDNKECQVSPSP